MSFEKGLFLRNKVKFPSSSIYNLQRLQQNNFFCFKLNGSLYVEVHPCLTC